MYNFSFSLKCQPLCCLLTLCIAFWMSPTAMAATHQMHHEQPQKNKKTHAKKERNAPNAPVKSKGKTEHRNAKSRSSHKTQQGLASYYGKGVEGNKTANGERFTPTSLTAAHRSLPFGTRLKVTNLKNHREVIVRVNDRGPFVKGRVIDVSSKAAQHIGLVADGVAPVKLEVLGSPSSS